ncbi:MAG TPA: DoxX family protein [Allosphingosinicella sp.]|jgi:putative oxidoreductase|uniref:DoxX family protein n=1 Tax=Allosphingosinicella sp. TaxID=2823234 RepID=UPI002F28AEDE
MRSRVTDLLLLTPLAQLGDLGLFLLRCVTGAFLIYQSHDNIISAARMDEFVKFLVQFNFWAPELMAPLSVWWQFIAGIGFIIGLLTRWLGLITAFNFIVAVWMVHWSQDFAGWWPALILAFLGLLFATLGPGRYALDSWIAKRARHDRDRTETAPAW